MNRASLRIRAAVLLAAVAALLAACQADSMTRSREETLQKYETIVRWSQWDAAVDYLAPEYLEENPITRLDMDRLRLFRVTQYIPRQVAVAADGMGVQQVVEIRLYNQREAVERSIFDRQLWKYDEETQRWLLHTGLPDVTQRY